jgi:transcriptional regulator with XRE-family HTH domain
MGRSPRPRPARLAEKLLAVRQRLDLSQTQMSKALGLRVDYSAISNYELGTREPPLGVLLKYARLAGVSTDVLIDDELEMPSVLPATPTHEELIMKQAGVRKRRRR